MNLTDLNSKIKARAKKFRVGRGHASGNGKTAGKGHKGQNARSGGGVRLGFEGGQMPLYRRLPKRGFTNVFAKKYVEINVEALNRLDDGFEVSAQSLKKVGAISKIGDGIVVLGRGSVNKKLFVKANRVSESARAKIVAAGGNVEVL